MKKLFALLLALTVLFSFAACGKKDSTDNGGSDSDTANSAAQSAEKSKQSDENAADTENDSKPSSADNSSSGSTESVDASEFEALMQGYEQAKEAGDEQAEREYLDKLQVIFEQVEENQ